jgi:hypothetical protein
LLWTERLLVVEFGPSRSKRFGKTVTLAQRGAGECTELEAGRYRVRFRLSSNAAAYTGLARLLERVRHWRATEVYEQAGPVSVYQAKEMARCASFQLTSFGGCRERFAYGVLPRCALCPLFDAERAIRAAVRRDVPPAPIVQIIIAAESWALLQEEFPPDLDPGWRVPDFPPAEWAEPADEEPPS